MRQFGGKQADAKRANAVRLQVCGALGAAAVALGFVAPLAAMEMPAVCQIAKEQTAEVLPARLRAVSALASADGTALTLEDGRTIRLADIGVPRAELYETIAGEKAVPQPPALAELEPGRSLLVSVQSDTPDRWGRIAAHVSLPGNLSGDAAAPAEWLSGHLVANGRAFVLPGDGETACIDALYALEADARHARRGLWRDPAHRVWMADDERLSEEATGAWRIVSGRVVSVGVTKTNHYLNFGRDWNTDFTVTVQTRDVERFAAAGRHPEGLKGRLVRVRGWLRKWNGAVIEVTRPGEIEVIDGRD